MSICTKIVVMDPVNIVDQERIESGWKFVVDVGREDLEDDVITFNVAVDEDYYDYLVAGLNDVSPEKLVEKTFEFLLSREPKESILRNFDLDVVGNYFDDYESEIVKLLSKDES